MDLKEEIRGLLQKGYSAINDLNKTSDMAPKQTLLKNNGMNSQKQARELIKELHQLVNVFDATLQTYLQNTVEQKMEILKYHSEEIIQSVDYMSNLCLTAENLLKENNLQVIKSCGPELKAEFVNSLEQCRELKMVDYETFTSLDIEVDISGILQLPLVNIVSWNHECLEKQIVHSLGFGAIDESLLPWSQSKPGAKSCHDNDLEYKLLEQSSMKSHKVNIQPNNLMHQNVNSVERQTTMPENMYNEVPCSGMPNMLKRDTAEMQYPRELKTKLLYLVGSHGDLNSLNSFSKSAREKQSPSSSLSNRSVQNPSCMNEHRHDLTVSKSVVSSASMGVARESLPIFQSIKVETPDEDDEMKKIEHALQLSLSMGDYSTAARQNKEGFSNAVLASMKIETEEHSSSEEKLTLSNAPDITILGFDSKVAASVKVKNESKDSSYSCNMRSWNSFRIGPVKMTFDLRTVMTSRSPHIFGRHVQTIDGGTCTTFDHPTGVAVTVDGYVVIADTGNHLVKVMDSNNLILTIGKLDGVVFFRPSAVVTDSEGNIYVKDDRCIQIFDRSGHLLDTIGKACFNHPYGLALTEYQAEPILVVVDSKRDKNVVYNYFIKGKRLASFTYGPTEEFNYPFSKLRFLAVHDNVMLVSDLGASNMYLSSINGQTLGSFGCFGNRAGNLKEPSGIAVDAVGNWIVGDSKNNRLQVFTKDGHFLTVITLSSSICRPSGIHLTSNGLLYVINYLDSFVKVFDLCH